MKKKKILAALEPIQKCAFMGCELEAGTPTLGELTKKKNRQAQLLLENYGFHKEDRLCEECFWK